MTQHRIWQAQDKSLEEDEEETWWRREMIWWMYFDCWMPFFPRHYMNDGFDCEWEQYYRITIYRLVSLFILWSFMGMPTLPREADMSFMVFMAMAGLKLAPSYFFQTPWLRSQQYSRKAKSGYFKQEKVWNQQTHMFVGSKSRSLQLQWLGISIGWMILQIAHRLETQCQNMKRHRQELLSRYVRITA